MKKLLLTTLILSMMTLTTHAEELTEEKIKRRDAILKAETQRKAEQKAFIFDGIERFSEAWLLLRKTANTALLIKQADLW